MNVNKVVVIIALVTACSIVSAHAADAGAVYTTRSSNRYVTMPVNVSFFPGFSLGESMARGRRIVNLFSLNILAGRAARLRGIEFGSIWNDYSENIEGAQFSGVINTVAGDGTGAQLAGVVNRIGGHFIGYQNAGVVNLVGGRFEGLQAGGVVNIVREAFHGVQVGGTANLVYDDFRGLQVGGVFNLSEGIAAGVQIAGVVNLANDRFGGVQVGGVLNRVGDKCEGLQVAGVINMVEGAFHGIQISGLVNFADRFESGIQLGVINIANDQRGLPVGVITIARNRQYIRLEAAGEDVMNIRVAFKLGVPYLYNIYAFGKLPGDMNRWAYGFGFGTETRIGRSFTLNLEAVANQEIWIDDNRVSHLLYIDRLNLLNQLKCTLGLHLTKTLCIFGGPTLNVLVADHREDGLDLGGDLAPGWTFYERKTRHWNQTDVKMWIGFTAGIRF